MTTLPNDPETSSNDGARKEADSLRAAEAQLFSDSPYGPAGVAQDAAAASRRGGNWATEEIAELNRQCLTANPSESSKLPGGRRESPARRPPPGQPLRNQPPLAHPPDSGSHPSYPDGGEQTESLPNLPAPQPYRSIRGERRQRFKMGFGEAARELEALEPAAPWSAALALALGLSTLFMAGPLSALGAGVAVAAIGTAAYAIYMILKCGYARGLGMAASGAGFAILFASIHNYDYSREGQTLRPAVDFLSNHPAARPSANKVELAGEDFERLDNALARYVRQHKKLPPAAKGNLGANARAGADNPPFSISTFRVHTLATDEFPALTTPVSYLSYLPPDPFTPPGAKATYGYYPAPAGECALLFSPGPDGEYQLDPESDFIPGNTASRDTLLRLRWDPTNGAQSKGDLWYVHYLPNAKNQSNSWE